jgi:hypothetical protein
MFWAEGPLPRLARLSLSSFRSNGFDVTLWSFTPDRLSDAGAELADAREIVARVGLSDVSGPWLSNLFRY